jgi:uncharacterized membrane protein (UPF0127 family)
MGVADLQPNEGCLLCFGEAQPVGLWMKNCKVNLQAAAIDQLGNIIGLTSMNYKDPYYIHHMPSSTRYVLEMTEGFFTKNNIKIGDKIRL